MKWNSGMRLCFLFKFSKKLRCLLGSASCSSSKLAIWKGLWDLYALFKARRIITGRRHMRYKITKATQLNLDVGRTWRFLSTWRYSCFKWFATTCQITITDWHRCWKKSHLLRVAEKTCTDPNLMQLLFYQSILTLNQLMAIVGNLFYCLIYIAACLGSTFRCDDRWRLNHLIAVTHWTHITVCISTRELKR